MSIPTYSPEANYLARTNVVHPQSNRGAAGDPYVAAAEAKGRADIADRIGAQSGATVTVTGGSIRKGR